MLIFLIFEKKLYIEWIDGSSEIIEKTLGWTVPPKQVLPHEVQALRGKKGEDGKKKSLKAKDLLSNEEYMYLIRDNIFDLLLFHIAKRIYLERLHGCSDIQ